MVGALDHTKCICYGRGMAVGMHRNEALNTTFHIQTYDRYDNQCIEGGGAFALGVNGSGTWNQEFRFKDNKDG